MMGHIRILLIEDEEIDRFRVKRILRETGMDAELVEVLDLESAKERLASEHFDCILLDQNLHDGTGLDFLDALNRSGKPCAIVMLTGHDDEKMDLAALQAGAEDYLSKGVGERFQDALRNQSFEGGPVTMSFGIVAYTARHQSGESLVKQADEALYAAKRAGRNRIVVAEDDVEGAAG